MIQKLNIPITEQDLKDIQDYLYKTTKTNIEKGSIPSWKNLVEIMSAESTILTAIHNIKSNKGSKTPGVDGKKMQEDILELSYDRVISLVQNKFKNYKSNLIRRVYIPKKNKNEKRPLGIPSILDRIVQECIRLILDPIAEAQFHEHSYGFRSYRDAKHAKARIEFLLKYTKYRWVIEGDISKFFDKVNHRRMLEILWDLGVRDRRLLMIIKEMLKAGIFNEIIINDMGTPQGGILSPLLANCYLNKLDQFVNKQWWKKKTKTAYAQDKNRLKALSKRSNLKPAYIVRYADDWVIITNSKINAEKWKWKVKEFLKDNLKLELSEEKTKITNVRRNPIKFLGFELKVVTNKKYPQSKPDMNQFKSKIKQIQRNMNYLRYHYQDKDILIHEINLINSQIRGIINYYNCCSCINAVVRKYQDSLKVTAYTKLRQWNPKWIPANEVNNLTSVHSKYTSQIPSIKYKEMWIGVTGLNFATLERNMMKNQMETMYTNDGREIRKINTNKIPLRVRADELLSDRRSYLIIQSKGTNYNFEYFLNRAYAFNRDKGKCKVCNKPLDKYNMHTHHINNKLNINKLNKVNNLASVCNVCHKIIHGTLEIHNNLEQKIIKKIEKYKNKLSFA